ncbi:4'-phosphopantetheinyl transferase family protein [Novispirillum sp. DQ9]|uniref:4'-phosphopantetheinyl transferase family protein n=1 Tax=Novispirillum sp. DQ9 TaxID=3398612 RepID=UPI003C7BC574
MAPELPPATAEAVWPWGDDPGGCRLVASRFGPEPEAEASPGIAVPPDLARAVPWRVAEYLAGRRCAQEAVRLLTGRRQAPGRGPDRAPLWPAGVVGSITHCGALALALAGPAEDFAGLGVDVERLLDADAARTVAPLVMTGDERRRWGGATDPGLEPFVVTLAFCAKESLFKALYPLVRRRFFFEAAELAGWDARGGAQLRLRADLGGGWGAGRVVEVRHCLFRGHLLTRAILPEGEAPEENPPQGGGTLLIKRVSRNSI